MEWPIELASQIRCRTRMPQRGVRARDEIAIGDFGDEVRRHPFEILVRCLLARGLGHQGEFSMGF